MPFDPNIPQAGTEIDAVQMRSQLNGLKAIIDAILTRRFYILTHPDWMPMITGRVDRIVEGRDPAVAGLPEPAGEG